MPLLEMLPGQASNPLDLIPVQMAVLAAMHWPLDASARRSFFYSKAQDGCEKNALATGELSLPAWFIRLRGKYVCAEDFLASSVPIASYAKKKHEKREDYPDIPATIIAGLTLLTALDLASHGDQVTLGKCQEIVASDLGGRMKTRVRDLRYCWSDYCSVSHLWAASMRMGFSSLCTWSPLHFSRFLIPAENYRRRGEQISIRNVGPLLDTSVMWKVPASAIWDII